ncbi:MAG: ATP-dependent Clp protease ATP-binding subunit, partial [Clostridia bacterium]|nr:ATP-dependent Clp protease ATP-binding subunit [Clostridia bacterium]
MNNKFTQRAQKSLAEAERIASELGHTYIGTEHILYGLVSEGEGVASKLLEGKGASAERIREIISDYAGVGTKTSLSASDMTPRSKKIIELSAYEASNTYSHYIGTEHLLLALLSENDSVGLKILNSMNINVNELRSELIAFFTNSSATRQKNQKKRAGASSLNPSEFPTLSSYGRDLTAMARLHKIDPIIARENEISRVIQILSRRTKNNPCLIGEPGVGKTAIAEYLAEEIVKGNVPETLKNKRVFTLDIASMLAG